MRILISFAVFVILQILFIPFAFIGGYWVYHKQIKVSRKLGVSGTAVEVLNGRWTMSVFDLRKDVATEKLVNALPNSSSFGLWLVLFPSYMLYKLSGRYFFYPQPKEEGYELLESLVTARTVYIDRLIAKSLADAPQLVTMGAGYDTRSYGDLQSIANTFYELDQVNTQKLKLEALNKAGIDHSHVQFVEVDFAQNSWFKKLLESGFDPNQKAVLLWEGVTLYLSEADVRKTMAEIKSSLCPGSVVVLDIYAHDFVTGELFPNIKKNLKTLEKTNESFDFGLNLKDIPREKLITFVESEGLELGEAFYMGEHTAKGVWMLVAEMIV